MNHRRIGRSDESERCEALLVLTAIKGRHAEYARRLMTLTE